MVKLNNLVFILIGLILVGSFAFAFNPIQKSALNSVFLGNVKNTLKPVTYSFVLDGPMDTYTFPNGIKIRWYNTQVCPNDPTHVWCNEVLNFVFYNNNTNKTYPFPYAPMGNDYFFQAENGQSTVFNLNYWGLQNKDYFFLNHHFKVTIDMAVDYENNCPVITECDFSNVKANLTVEVW